MMALAEILAYASFTTGPPSTDLEFWVNCGKIQETVRCVLFLAAYLVRKVYSEPNVMPRKLTLHYSEP